MTGFADGFPYIDSLQKAWGSQCRLETEVHREDGLTQVPSVCKVQSWAQKPALLNICGQQSRSQEEYFNEQTSFLIMGKEKEVGCSGQQKEVMRG